LVLAAVHPYVPAVVVEAPELVVAVLSEVFEHLIPVVVAEDGARRLRKVLSGRPLATTQRFA
jgi:hypothetical protein